MNDSEFIIVMNQLFDFSKSNGLMKVATTAVRDTEQNKENRLLNQDNRIQLLDEIVADWKQRNNYEIQVYLFISR